MKSFSSSFTQQASIPLIFLLQRPPRGNITLWNPLSFIFWETKIQPQSREYTDFRKSFSKCFFNNLVGYLKKTLKAKWDRLTELSIGLRTAVFGFPHLMFWRIQCITHVMQLTYWVEWTLLSCRRQKPNYWNSVFLICKVCFLMAFEYFVIEIPLVRASAHVVLGCVTHWSIRCIQKVEKLEMHPLLLPSKWDSKHAALILEIVEYQD